MRIGITGSRDGMTHDQRLFLLLKIADNYPHTDTWILHGDCIGVDAEAHDMAVANGLLTEVFPPDKAIRRANKKGTIIHAPRGYVERDHDIVDACDILYGFPSGYEEVLRSGTWLTIRYARKTGVPVTIIYPDGTHHRHKGK